MYSQWIVEDPAVAGLIASLNSQQAASNSKSLVQAANTVKQLQSQGKWIKETVEKVDNAVRALSVVTDIQKNAVGVVKDYNNTANSLRDYKTLNPEYVENALRRLAGIVSKNQKTVDFFTSIMKSDFLKLSSYERIKLLEDINSKLSSLRGGIYNIGAEAYQKNQQSINRKSIYGTPILK
ncbi:hypothetical protein C1631_022870 [Chryseobacterium phosphatilyticum]|uniref:Uncharacterized protein n=2 Tax=Chryseobacterium phosphatilyticum TaxID=475075 RepID=A0A316WLX3_9FLAO|nr:hypothetical protein C1631_022870 [Chryseobacterium phosphatilyticum]